MATARLQALRQVHTPLPAREIRAPEAVRTPGTGGRSQADLGNDVVSGIVNDKAGDVDSLYLADLLAASAETGEDLTAFLPWRANGSWTQFVRAWYRVILAERDRADATGAFFAVDLEGGGIAADGSAADGAALADGGGLAETGLSDGSGAGLDGLASGFAGGVEAAFEGGMFEGASLDAGVEGAVARDARGPNIADPGEMNQWFDRLERQTDAGRALTADERSLLEEVHGQSIPSTRIHEGAFARQMSSEIDARAFTVGRDVWMGEDVDLADPRGAELLAHEITHVIQNALGRGGTGKPVSSPGDASEREAEARGRDAAGLVARGEWGIAAPEGVGAQGRFLASRIASQLPETPPPAPVSLVQEGVRTVLAGRAEARIVALRAELAELDRGRADVRDAEARLEDARALVAAAGADAASLAALIGIGGAPTAGELQGLQAGFAPYPTFAAQAATLVGSLAPAGTDLSAPTEDPALAILGGIRDVDPARALATAALVDRFAQALRLSPTDIDVRVDASAADRLSAIGAPGLYEGGAILLDPAQYDPSTTAGAALLAHEMVHVAQDGLPTFEGMGAAADFDAGGLAEAEAHVAGSALATGGAFHDVTMGLPEGHVAAKDDLFGDALRNLLQLYQGVAEGVKFGGTGTAPGGADKNATQNREEKLSQYEDGVDGIADEIGDLDAFDDLCDAVDEAEDAKDDKTGDKKEGDAQAAGGKGDTKGPLARVKASSSYKELCKMWQGAKEGGDDSDSMKAKFENEFDGRGFWGSTEKAFDLVSANAKRDAKPEPAAEEGKKNAKDGEKKAADVDTKSKADKDGGTAAAGKAGSGLAAKAAGGDFAQFLGSSVEDEIPKIPSFEQMNGVSDEQFTSLTGKVDTYNGFAVDAQKNNSTGRTADILGTLGKSFLGNFGSSFADQFIDSMVWDSIGAGGDKLLSLATKGRVGGAGAPMIGPLIGLGKEVWGAWDKDGFNAGKFAGSALGGDKFGSGFSSFGKIGETLGGLSKAGSVTDVIGVLSAAAADFFGGLRDLMDGLASLCGTLSALCYIVGGVLILVGIATAWLGWGIGLITAGNWLVRIGSVLGRINTALGLLVIFLSGVTTFFRTIAAFTVPAEMYADQLAGVGSAASNFGEKTGAKLGDTSASKTKDAISQKFSGKGAGQQKTPGEQEGAQKHQDAQQDIDGNAKKLEGVKDQLDDAKKQIGDDDAKKKAEDDAKKAKGDDAEGQKGKGTPRERILKRLDKLTQFSELKSAFSELKNVSKGAWDKDVRRKASGEAMTPEALAVHTEKISKHLDKAEGEIHALKAQLEDAQQNRLSERDYAEIQNKIGKAEADLARQRQELAAMKASVDAAQDLDKLVEDEKAAEEENKKRKKEKKPELLTPQEKAVAAKKKALDEAAEKAKAAKDGVDQANAKVTELEAKQKGARDDADALRREIGDPEEAKKTIAAHEEKHRADEQKKRDADKVRADEVAAEAAALDKKAADADKAARLRDEAATIEADIQRTQANQAQAMETLRGQIGNNVTIKDQPGKKKTVNAAIREVTADGIVVTDGNGGVRTVPFGSVVGPSTVLDASNQLRTAKKDLKTAEPRRTELVEQADALAPAGADPAKIRAEADAKRAESGDLATRGNAPIGPAPTHPITEKQSASAKLDAEAARLQAQLDEARGGIGAEQAKLDTAKQTEAKARTELTAAEKLAEEVKGKGHANTYLRESSSGNATGGVGSSFKFWGEALERLLLDYDKVIGAYREAGAGGAFSKAAELAKEPGEGEDRSKSFGTKGMDFITGKLPFLKADTDGALKAIGAKTAAIEKVLELSPPVDIEETKKKRLAAAEHFTKYKSAHDHALQAWKAEQAVEKLSKETKALAEAGKPIQDASKQMANPLQKSKGDEERRAAVISGQDPNAPKQEGGAGGIVGDLIMKLASHSDGMDQQPNAGGKDGGKAIEDGQDKGKKDSKENVDRTKQLSDQQRQFLDDALSLRQKQETNVADNISATEAKYQEEQAIKAEIQQIKAKALAEREAERAEVEKNADAFNGDHEQLSAWSQDFTGRLAAVQGAGSK